MHDLKSIGKVIGGALSGSSKAKKKKVKTGKGRDVAATDSSNYVENGSEEILADASHKKTSLKKLKSAFNIKKKTKEASKKKKKNDDTSAAVINTDDKTVKEGDNESLAEADFLSDQTEPHNPFRKESSSEDSGLGDENQNDDSLEEELVEINALADAEEVEKNGDDTTSESDSTYGEDDQSLDIDTTFDGINSDSIQETAEKSVVTEGGDVGENNLFHNVDAPVLPRTETVLDTPQTSSTESQDAVSSQNDGNKMAADVVDMGPKKKKTSNTLKGMMKAVLGKKKTVDEMSHVTPSNNVSNQKTDSSRALDVVHKKISQPKKVAKTVVQLASAIKRPQDAIAILSRINNAKRAVQFVSDFIGGGVPGTQETGFNVKTKSFKNEWLASNVRQLEKENNLNIEEVNKLLLEKRSLLKDYMPMIDCMIEWNHLSGENKRAENLKLFVTNLREDIPSSISRKEFQKKLFEIDDALVRLDKVVTSKKMKKYLLDVKPKKSSNREKMLYMLFKKNINNPLNKTNVDCFEAVSNYLALHKEDGPDNDQLYFDIMKVFFDDYESLSYLIDGSKDMLAVCDFIDQYMRFDQMNANLKRLQHDIDNLRANNLVLDQRIENDIEKARTQLAWFSNIAAKGKPAVVKLKKSEVIRQIKSLRESVRDYEKHNKEVAEKTDLLKRATFIIPEFIAEVQRCDDEVYKEIKRDEHDWNYRISRLKGIKLKNAFLNKILPKKLARELVRRRIVSLDKREIEAHDSKVNNLKRLQELLELMRQKNILIDGPFDKNIGHQTYNILIEMLSKSHISEDQADNIFHSLFMSETLASSINKIDFNFLISADIDSLKCVKRYLRLYEEHINEAINKLDGKALKSRKLRAKLKNLRSSAGKVKAAIRALDALKERKITKNSILSILDIISDEIDRSLVDQTDKKYIDDLKCVIGDIKFLDIDGDVRSVKDEKTSSQRFDGEMTEAFIDNDLLQYLKRDEKSGNDGKTQFDNAELKLYEAKAYIKLWSSLVVRDTAYDKLPRDMHRTVNKVMEFSRKIKEKADGSDDILSGDIDRKRTLAYATSIVGVSSRLKVAETINKESIVVMTKDFPPIETAVEMSMLRGLVEGRLAFINKRKSMHPELSDILNKKYKIIDSETCYIDNLNRAERENGLIIRSLLNAYKVMLGDSLAKNPHKTKDFLSGSAIGQYFAVSVDSSGNPALVQLNSNYTNFLDAKKLIEAVNHEIKTEGDFLDIHHNVMKMAAEHKDLHSKLCQDKKDDGHVLVKIKDGAVYSVKEATNDCQSLWEEFPVGLIYFAVRRQKVLEELREKAQQARNKGKNEKDRLLSSACEKIEKLPIDTPDFIEEVYKILDQLYVDLKQRRRFVRRTRSYSDLVEHTKSLITHQGYNKFMENY